MSGTLRAQFQLDLADGMSAPIERIERVLQGLQQALEALKRPDPFSQIMEPVPRATQAVEGLTQATKTVTQAMEGATGATEALGEALGGTSEAAQAAGNNLREIGAEAEIGADRAVSAMERVRRAVAGVGSAVGGGGAAGGGHGSGGLGGAFGHFRESFDHAEHAAMAAAMNGLMFVEPVHAAAEYQNAATHIGLTLGIQGTQNAAFSTNLMRQVDAWSRQYGQRGSDVMEAATFLNQEGYSQDRMNALVPVIAQISTAYNAHPDAVARTAFALNQNLGVATQDTNVGLAMLARVGKMSALPFEELAPLFPELASSAAGLGVHGLSQISDLGGMLALIRKNTGTPGEATSSLRAFMQTITSPHARHRFAEYGVDLTGTLLSARHSGGDPLLAVLNKVMSIRDPDRRFAAIGDLFGNERDQLFVRSMDRDWKLYGSMRDQIARTSPGMIGEDYRTARANSDLTKLNSFQEALSQTNRRIGDGFVPVLQKATVGLDHFLDAWDHLDKAFLKATPTVLAIGGGTLAFAAAMAALGAIWGPLVAAAGLLAAALGAVLSPVGLVVAAIGGAALVSYELVHHLDAVGNAMMRLGHIIATMVRGIPGAAESGLNFLENYAKDVWNDPTGTKNLHMHTAPLQPIGPGIPAHVVITHDGSLNVAPRSSPQVRVTTQRVPGTGRTVNRP